MKLALQQGNNDAAQIQAYAVGSVTIGGRVYSHSVLLSPDQPALPWPPQRFEDISAEHFEMLATAAPEIVLVGTGRRLVFPASSTLLPLTSRRIGLEIMDTGAACRAYNFLVGEGRRVAAALLMIGQ